MKDSREWRHTVCNVIQSEGRKKDSVHMSKVQWRIQGGGVSWVLRNPPFCRFACMHRRHRARARAQSKTFWTAPFQNPRSATEVICISKCFPHIEGLLQRCSTRENGDTCCYLVVIRAPSSLRRVQQLPTNCTSCALFLKLLWKKTIPLIVQILYGVPM